MNKENDRMPEYGTPEYDALYERALRLSKEDVIDLLDLVGIRFASRHSKDQPASRAELLEDDKDMLLGPFDEADSLAKVEQFLKEHGV